MTTSLLRGAIDTHIHAAPDVVDRIDDFVGVAKKADEAGMAGLVFKDLSGDTVDRAYSINRMGLSVEAIGGVVLDLPVGGINPRTVDRSLRKGARVIWMPVAHSRNTLDRFQTGNLNLLIPPDVDSDEALTVLTPSGDLTQETVDIVEMVAAFDAVLAAGHLSVEETKALFAYASAAGVRRLLVNHPCGNAIGASIPDQRDLSELGAVLEHCYAQTTVGLDELSMASIAGAIRAVGPEHCVLATDLGQTFNPPHVEGLELFASGLYEHGITLAELKRMLSDNAKELFHSSECREPTG